jgi:hypothetical protein
MASVRSNHALLSVDIHAIVSSLARESPPTVPARESLELRSCISMAGTGDRWEQP